jgi:hypothetical protein
MCDEQLSWVTDATDPRIVALARSTARALTPRLLAANATAEVARASLRVFTPLVDGMDGMVPRAAELVGAFLDKQANLFRLPARIDTVADMTAFAMRCVDEHVALALRRRYLPDMLPLVNVAATRDPAFDVPYRVTSVFDDIGNDTDSSSDSDSDGGTGSAARLLRVRYNSETYDGIRAKWLSLVPDSVVAVQAALATAMDAFVLAAARDAPVPLLHRVAPGAVVRALRSQFRLVDTLHSSAALLFVVLAMFRQTPSDPDVAGKNAAAVVTNSFRTECLPVASDLPDVSVACVGNPYAAVGDLLDYAGMHTQSNIALHRTVRPHLPLPAHAMPNTLCDVVGVVTRLLDAGPSMVDRGSASDSRTGIELANLAQIAKNARLYSVSVLRAAMFASQQCANGSVSVGQLTAFLRTGNPIVDVVSKAVDIVLATYFLDGDVRTQLKEVRTMRAWYSQASIDEAVRSGAHARGLITETGVVDLMAVVRHLRHRHTFMTKYASFAKKAKQVTALHTRSATPCFVEQYIREGADDEAALTTSPIVTYKRLREQAILSEYFAEYEAPVSHAPSGSVVHTALLRGLPSFVTAAGRPTFHSMTGLAVLAMVDGLRNAIMQAEREAVPAAADPSRFPVCAVCMEGVVTTPTLSCSHPVCASCLADRMRMLATDTGAEDTMSCPVGATCKGRVNLFAIRTHVSPALRAVVKMATRMLKAEVAVVRDCNVQCPECRLDMTRDPDGNSVYSCTVCGMVSCAVCNGVAHPGVVCIRRLNTVTGGGDAVTVQDLLSEVKMVACPGCGVGITKARQCNHMTCTNRVVSADGASMVPCNTHFCYCCAVRLNADDVDAHYAPYGPCNKMEYSSTTETLRMQRAITTAVAMNAAPFSKRPVPSVVGDAASHLLTAGPFVQTLADL